MAFQVIAFASVFKCLQLCGNKQHRIYESNRQTLAKLDSCEC
jgi:hypothetical protein